MLDIFLKSRHEAGETIVVYARRLREKAHQCDFGSSNDDRIEKQYSLTFCLL